MSLRAKIRDNFIAFLLLVALFLASLHVGVRHIVIISCNEKAKMTLDTARQKSPTISLTDAYTLKEAVYSNCVRGMGFEP